MRYPSRSNVVVWCVTLSLAGGVWAEEIVNGDFESRDLTGWTVVVRDGDSIGVGVDGGRNYHATFSTGAPAVPFVSFMEQSFVVDEAMPLLSFDFTKASATKTTGDGEFIDGLFVLLEVGQDLFDLMAMDASGYDLTTTRSVGSGGSSVQPWNGPAQVHQSPLNPAFDYAFTADLSSLIGKTVTFAVEIVNEEDGSVLSWSIDNIRTGPAQVPEPASVLLWGLGFLLLRPRHHARGTIRCGPRGHGIA